MSQTKAQLLAPIGIITGPGLDVTTASGTTFQLGSTGIITAVSANFSGNVTVGGTLTYEDVNNIDSVGLITARSGIDVNAGGIDVTAGGIDVVGVVTASTGINAASNLILNTGGSERLRIASAGQVGIGGTNYGTSGQVLTSQGNAAAPQWVDSGGAWIKMASVDVAAGVAGTTYDVFTDFASHTDKKWWKLIFAHESVDTSDDLGLEVKIGGNWITEGYNYQQMSQSGTTEVANFRTNRQWHELGNGQKWNRGEVLFFNNSAPNVFQLFNSQTISINYNYTVMGQYQMSGGAVGAGSSGTLQGIRLAHDDANWGALNFALFAGNGW